AGGGGMAVPPEGVAAGVPAAGHVGLVRPAGPEPALRGGRAARGERPGVDVRPADALPRRRRLHSHRCEAPHSTRRALGTDPGWELICGAGGRIVTSEAAEECPMPDTDFTLEKAEADFGFSTLPGLLLPGLTLLPVPDWLTDLLTLN